MNQIKIHIAIIVTLLALSACGSKKVLTKKEPDWVQQRPINTMYYIGIGHASKLNNKLDYLQVAKKNALQDLTGEIKVTIASNSLLSQQQNNLSFSQQYYQDIRAISEESLSGFDVVDAYETSTDYFIYYRLSKAQYEAEQRKQVEAAIQKALNYLNQANEVNAETEYMQALRYRIKALAALQQYAHVSLETYYLNKNVYLMSEIIAQIQRQLFQVKLTPSQQNYKAIVGRPISNSIEIKCNINGSNLPVKYLPLTWKNKQGSITGTGKVQSNDNGIANFFVNRITGNQPTQQIEFLINTDDLFALDSFSLSMQRVIKSFDVPQTVVNFLVEPIKIWVESDEKNINKNLEFNMLEAALKKQLAENGCTFVNTAESAQYKIIIKSNTKDEGSIWGNMLQSVLTARLSMVDLSQNAEILKEELNLIKGYQLTPEKAGLDAYANAAKEFNNNITPKIIKLIINP